MKLKVIVTTNSSEVEKQINIVSSDHENEPEGVDFEDLSSSASVDSDSTDNSVGSQEAEETTSDGEDEEEDDDEDNENMSRSQQSELIWEEKIKLYLEFYHPNWLKEFTERIGPSYENRKFCSMFTIT